LPWTGRGRGQAFLWPPGPPEAFNVLEQACGFEDVGTPPEMDRKFNRFWDVAVYLKPLPLPLAGLQNP